MIIRTGIVGKTYLIGGLSEDIPNLEVVKRIIGIMGKSEDAITYVADRPGHDVRYAIDWSETEKELGYHPQASFNEYLEKTVRWYVNHQDWWRRVKSGEYQNYYEKQYGY